MFGDSQAFMPTASDAKEARPEGRPRADDQQAVLPATIRQVEHAVEKRAASGGEAVTFFGVEPAALILVGAVESVVRQGMSLELVLNDGTGRIRARHFVTQAAPGEFDQIVPGRYVYVFGSVRTAPAVHFAANRVKLVQSPDEVSYHTIEAAHAALRLQAKPKQAAAAAPPEKLPAAGPAPEAARPAPAEPAKAGALAGEALQEAVRAMIQETTSEAGAAVSAMVAKLGAPEAEVRSCIARLVDMGDVFEGADGDHFLFL